MRFFKFFIMVIFIDFTHCSFYFIPSSTKRGKRSDEQIIPWIGILRVRLPNERSDAVAGLILIAEQTAIASASDVIEIDKSTLRKTTKALFYNNDHIQWECSVKDYTVHPEFDVETTNTLAVVKLEDNPEHPHFLWHPVSWPCSDESEKLNIFTVGFSDARNVLEQRRTKMVAVNRSTCKEFYKKEKLDYHLIWPTHYRCFKAAKSRSTCVYDAGMALAHWNSSNDQWTLLGVSTFGPGCSLPSRFIQVQPYTSWLASYVPTRRQFNVNYNETWAAEPFEDIDTMVLSHLSDSAIVLREELAGINKTLRGRCDSRIDGNVTYRDEAKFDAGDDYKRATVLYSISLFDLRVRKVTCLMVNVNCTKRSKAKLSFHKGLGQEDLEDLIQRIPWNRISSKQTVRPKIIHIPGKYTGYRSNPVTTLWFKFEFMGRAFMKVVFYGTRK